MIRWNNSRRDASVDADAALCFQGKPDPLHIVEIVVIFHKSTDPGSTWNVTGHVSFSNKTWEIPGFELEEGESKVLGIWDQIFRVPGRDHDVAAALETKERAALKRALRSLYNQPLLKLEVDGDGINATSQRLKGEESPLR